MVSEESPILGVEFDPHPDAEFVDGTGQIAIERQIGRGRVVATAFSMDDKPVIRWPGYRNFFNGCLLRRPGRKFGPTSDGTLSFNWTSDDTSIFRPVAGKHVEVSQPGSGQQLRPDFLVATRGNSARSKNYTGAKSAVNLCFRSTRVRMQGIGHNL